MIAPAEAPLLREVRAVTPVMAFAALDERIAQGDGGIVVVHVVDDRSVDALCAHLTRRARGSHSLVISARGHVGGPVWREVAARLGVGKVDCAPSQCAAQLASAAHGRRAAILLTLPRGGSWDRAVLAELSHVASLPLVVVLAPGIDPVRDLRGEVYEVAPALDEADKRRWVAALAGDALHALPQDDLYGLESWWSAAKTVAPRVAPTDIPLEGRSLFLALSLTGRGWHEHDLPLLGASAGGLRALESAGLVAVERGFFALAAGTEPLEDEYAAHSSKEMCARVARALEHRFPEDPWAHARAAELFLRGGHGQLADEAYGRALDGAEDGLVRREVVATWMRAIDIEPAESQLPLRMRAAERALAAGEADEAYRWAKGAASLAPAAGQAGIDDTDVTLLLGRAAVAMGDLVTAQVALERGRAAVTDPDVQARIAAELAEVAYVKGDANTAEIEARLALAGKDPVTRLRARNTLGKLLLADGKWDEAERQFTEDAQTAARARDHAGEMRAHLNRGITLLSRGQLAEAHRVFEQVLETGTAARDDRACAFALGNMAVVAMERHAYGEALVLSERTLTVRLRIGDRIQTGRVLANLAELRGKLGLFQYADHALAFGRRLLGPGMPFNLTAHFAIVAARVALMSKRTSDAQRELMMVFAQEAAEMQRDAELVGEAYRIAARLAIEDGDVPRAEQALLRATELGQKDFARAEIASIQLAVARAKGEVDAALVDSAISLARRVGEEELLREVHTLASQVFGACGDVERAGAHLAQAIAMRDAVAATIIDDDVRAAFLRRPDVASLSSELATLTPVPPPLSEEGDGPTTQRSPTPVPARSLIGDDPAIRALLNAIRKIARTDGTVLIRGESGTGKELVAEALHRSSERGHGPFVAVNCAALVETLLLSELFGHEKGAFTGAVARRRGRFEMAEGGTLFLDEIGDISPRTQVALLRVLQERTYERVGGTTAIRANCRIICATHRDLKAMVERGEFREDLYYRLRGITLEVPALRQRMGDLPRIAEHLLGRIAAERVEPIKSLSPDALDLLSRHRWPGNVRELENALRAASLFAETNVITSADFAENVEDLRNVAASRSTPPPPVSIVDAVEASGVEEVDETAPLPQDEAGATAVAYACVRQGSVSLQDLKRQIERDCVARALAETRGNITRAAALLGMKRPRLSQLVKQYGLTAVSSENQ